MFVPVVQVIAEENQMRQDLQMTLDSKDSDIEQLRCQLTSLSVHSLDSTSISSGNDLDVGDGYPGRQYVNLTLIITFKSVFTSCIPLSPVSLPESLLFPFFPFFCLSSRPTVFDLFLFMLFPFPP